MLAVHYPGLPSSRFHKRAAALFTDGGCGGVLAFELAGGVDAAEAAMRRLQLGLVAPSLGGVETLVTRCAPNAGFCFMNQFKVAACAAPCAWLTPCSCRRVAAERRTAVC